MRPEAARCDPPGLEPGSPYLARCAAEHEALVAEALARHARGEDELALTAIREAAHHAWFHHPGRFADARLENAALAIGRRLAEEVDAALLADLRRAFAPAGGSAARHVLHVVSRALEIGGHTRLVMSWIENDASSRHSVLLSFQSHQPFRADFEPLVRERGGGFRRLPVELSNLGAVAAVRAAADMGFDLVVLHSHPDDPYPTAALALAGGPPVLLLDHADHCFWLGSSVADVTVHLRGTALRLARARRFVRDAMALPNPVVDPVPGGDLATRRKEARRRLGLPADRPLLLSVGTGYKWTPAGDVDFLRAAERLLERVPAAHLCVVGMWLPPCGRRLPARIHALGTLGPDDVRRQGEAADVFLEPFPFGSMTSTLEAVLAGSVPVLGPEPAGSRILISCGDALEERVPRPADEDAWIEAAARWLREPARRAEEASRLRELVLDRHRGASWRSRLAALYARAAATPHAPAPLPPDEPRDEIEDRVVSRFCEATQRSRSRER